MSGDAWSHPNKEWRETLQLARSLGWSSRVAKGHGGLIVECPAEEAGHRIRVYLTAKGTENVARQTRRKIRACPHRDLTEPLVRIRGALDGAERLLDAAHELLLVAFAEQRMQDLLDSVDLAGRELEDVTAEFDAMTRAQEEAASQARGLMGSDDLARSPGEVSDEAEVALHHADRGLERDLPKEHEDWDPLRARHDALGGRLEAIRARLRGEQPDPSLG